MGTVRRTFRTKIVSGAELGEDFDLSERSIREHRAKGHVVRLGHGYDYRKSLRGMVDHSRVEAAKKGVGDPGQTLWETYRDALAYRSRMCDDRDWLIEGLEDLLERTDLPETVRDALNRLLAPLPIVSGGEDDEEGEG